MSMSGDEWQAEDWALEQLEYYRRIALADFAAERLTSYFRLHPKVAQSPRRLVDEAHGLLSSYPTQAFLSAAIAVEVSFKDVFLRPIVFGLIRSEAAADLITKIAMRMTRFDRLTEYFVPLLREHGGLDLATVSRAGATQLLTKEMVSVQRRRDRVVHTAEAATAENAEQAINLAEYLLDRLLPLLADNLGLHVHADHSICDGDFCRGTEGIELLRAEA
jgi:hypothetical protein